MQKVLEDAGCKILPYTNSIGEVSLHVFDADGKYVGAKLFDSNEWHIIKEPKLSETSPFDFSFIIKTYESIKQRY